MLLTLIIILILIWAAVVWSIYSNFLVFYSNFSESENYHKAYYTSISALERGELVTRQRDPWYVWSGGFILWVWKWSRSNWGNYDWWSDKSLNNLSYLWEHSTESSVFRTVNSRTTRIPKEWKWNVESFLSANDSSWYNMMDYENAEVFLLYYDNSDNNPYTSWTIADSRPNEVKWEIRLPKRLVDSLMFWRLDTSHQSLWAGLSRPTDDAMIDRQIRWKNNSAIPFTIYSTQTTNGSLITKEFDTVFRESDLNNNWWWLLSFNFWGDWNPIKNTASTHWDHNPITIISQIEPDVKGKGNFKNVFNYSNYHNIQLRFNLLNLLKTTNGKIYPFLEYYADFWTYISDKNFTIKWEWNYSDYNVNIIFQRPTVKETVLSNFTSIF